MSNLSILDFARPQVRALQAYKGGKPIEEAKRELGLDNFVKLASNECPYPSSLAVRSALAKTAMECNLYPDGNAFELKKLLAKKHEVLPSQITIGNGSNEMLELLVLAFTCSKRNDRMLTGKHAFLVYQLLATTHGISYQECKLDNWRIDCEALAAALDESVRLVCIANPANPTGTTVNNDALEKFIANTKAYTLVMLDQAYADFYAPSDHAISWLSKYPNLVITRTFSKACGLAGLRVGYSISSVEIADLLNRVRQPFNLNSHAQAAAIAVLNDPQTLVKTINNNASYKQKLKEVCDELNLGYLPSDANFLTIDFISQQPADSFTQGLLSKGIIVRGLANYAMPNMVRITIGKPDQMELLFAAMRELIQTGL